MKPLLRGVLAIVFLSISHFQPANSTSIIVANQDAWTHCAPVVAVAFSISPGHDPLGRTLVAATGNLAKPHIVDHTPPCNGLDVDRTATISVTFDTDMDAGSINASTFVVNGAISGRHSGLIEYDAPSRTAEFTPQTPYAIGEVVSVTITTGIQSGGAEPLDSAYVWQFTARAEGGTGRFDLGYMLPMPDLTTYVAAADFNGDDLNDLAVVSYTTNSLDVMINNGDSTLAVGSSYPTPNAPLAVCVGDLNGDGRADIATAGNLSKAVYVYLNGGDGTFFALQDSITVDSGPRSIISADIDGDGDLDLITANQYAKSLSVIKNDGSGTFAQDSAYVIGGSVFFVNAADFDLDGQLDLVVATSGIDSAYVMHNIGNGIYEGPVTYPSGGKSRGTAVGDFNGDGNADFAVASDVAFRLYVFLNDGNGDFGNSHTDSTGKYKPFVLSSGDLDADGDIDIATANGGHNSTSIMLNDGDGNFVLDHTYEPALNIYGVVQADMDGDGDLDIVLTSYLPNNVIIYYNKDRNVVDSMQPGVFAESVPVSDSIVIFFRVPINAASLNENTLIVRSQAYGIVAGTIEIPSSTVAIFKPDHPLSPGDKITVRITDGIDVVSSDRFVKSYTSSFTTTVHGGVGAFQSPRQFAVDQSPQALCAADLNNDGLKDIALASTDRNLITLLVNNGDSTFTHDTAMLTERLPYDIAAADLDDDGDLDLIMACLGDSSVVICYNDGTGKCESTSRFSEGISTSSVAVADFDNDGYPDIAAAKVYSESTYVYINDGLGGFSAPGIPYYMRSLPYKITAVDIDSDGDEDIVSVPYSDEHFVGVLFNNGVGGFGQFEYEEVYPSDSGDFADSTHSLYAGDLNGDGFADLAVGNVRLDNVSILMNDSSGAFSSVTVYESISQPHSIFGGDFDGDGDIDLAVGNQTVPGSVTLMENAGDGTFGNFMEFEAASKTNAIVGADIDGDGDMDILTANGDDVNASNISLLLDRDTAYVEPLPITDTIPRGDSCLMQVKVTGDPDDVVLHYRLGGETIWTDTVLQSSDTVYQCKIATDLTGLRSTGYYFEVNQLEVTKTLPTVSASTNPDYIRSELTDILTRDLQDSVYLIIGFPFDVDPADPAAVFQDDFDEYNVLRWRLGRWDPDIPGYVEYPALDSIRRGDGYWLHNRTGAHLDASGYSALPDTVINDTAYARIDLRPGWNQIATPFDFRVSWNHRRLNNDIDVLLNAYAATDSGSYYYATDTLLPFHGYFLYSNAAETTPLFLPYIRANLLPTVALLPLAPRHDFWQAQIGLESDGAADVTNTFGVRPQATAGRDTFDSHEPPLPPGRYVSLCFEQPTDVGKAELLNGDFREPGRGWVFSLLVRGNTGAAARVRLTDTLLFPSEYEVVLLDTVTGVTYPISRTGVLSLPRIPSVEGARYRLIVGDKAYIDAHSGSDAAIPERFCLYQNHPNPFNPATTIRFDLPAPAHTRLDVFNILGQRVTTLLDADMPAGSHAVRWDGRDGNGQSVASGVYFYRLSAGTEAAKRKMILVK